MNRKGFGVRGSGFGVRGSGFGVRGSGFGVRGSGFGVRGSGFGRGVLAVGLVLALFFTGCDLLNNITDPTGTDTYDANGTWNFSGNGSFTVTINGTSWSSSIGSSGTFTRDGNVATLYSNNQIVGTATLTSNTSMTLVMGNNTYSGTKSSGGQQPTNPGTGDTYDVNGTWTFTGSSYGESFTIYINGSTWTAEGESGSFIQAGNTASLQHSGQTIGTATLTSNTYMTLTLYPFQGSPGGTYYGTKGNGGVNPTYDANGTWNVTSSYGQQSFMVTISGSTWSSSELGNSGSFTRTGNTMVLYDIYKQTIGTATLMSDTYMTLTLNSLAGQMAGTYYGTKGGGGRPTTPTYSFDAVGTWYFTDYNSYQSGGFTVEIISGDTWSSSDPSYFQGNSSGTFTRTYDNAVSFKTWSGVDIGSASLSSYGEKILSLYIYNRGNYTGSQKPLNPTNPTYSFDAVGTWYFTDYNFYPSRTFTVEIFSGDTWSSSDSSYFSGYSGGTITKTHDNGASFKALGDYNVGSATLSWYGEKTLTLYIGGNSYSGSQIPPVVTTPTYSFDAVGTWYFTDYNSYPSRTFTVDIFDGDTWYSSDPSYFLGYSSGTITRTSDNQASFKAGGNLDVGSASLSSYGEKTLSLYIYNRGSSYAGSQTPPIVTTPTYSFDAVGTWYFTDYTVYPYRSFTVEIFDDDTWSSSDPSYFQGNSSGTFTRTYDNEASFKVGGDLTVGIATLSLPYSDSSEKGLNLYIYNSGSIFSGSQTPPNYSYY